MLDLLSNLSGGSEGPSQQTSQSRSGSFGNLTFAGGAVPQVGDPASLAFRGQNMGPWIVVGGLALVTLFVFFKK